ncbi:PLP-dependent transferase [Metschnikowia bicuspidata var. bicuspidata NRRL YB-4993]|uniref:PLP-dependent transferase n=1 Tax=Metschnikowia bicuspidata var. bicuspidata NRRL YB-4993 TaxID=869754 RepID=A0A1A0HHY1_9ASCO|nr:PLP-dependent transferase [Metschnikowia bicuspidata var. bicuspidata NRRL YB-4993]OBA23769.1 PLP-dependent transferase [Metschnikowia bicuspidata var. bicuspidata NRRL YB-4993]
MAPHTFFALPDASEDPIVALMNAYAADQHPAKIDVSIGVYKSEEGDPNYVFPSVKAAKSILAADDPGHCYTQMSGIPAFVAQAQKTIFGDSHADVASVQSVAGSGALHLAFALLVELGLTDFHVGEPCWGNYQGMVEHAGGLYIAYSYYDAATHTVDFDAIVHALSSAREGAVFVLQAVCHNPTGLDLTQAQWLRVFGLIRARKLFALFDIAYQGFASGDVDQDAWAIREAWRQGLEFMVCQSYSKNMGLYSERVGCTHVRARDEASAQRLRSALTRLVRTEFSFAPAFGARVAAILQENPQVRPIWLQDVRDVTARLRDVRQKMLETFEAMGTPGTWDHVTRATGMFWFTGLSRVQTQKLQEEHHIYGTSNGRVNVAGLNNSNIAQYCAAVDAVVRKYPGH